MVQHRLRRNRRRSGRRAVTLLLLALWLGADAALLSDVLVDWWACAQYLVTTAPRHPQRHADGREPTGAPQPIPAPPVLARLEGVTVGMQRAACPANPGVVCSH